MPHAPAKPCRHPGCPALNHDGYCPAHLPLYPAYERRPDSRPSSSRRGYGASWRKIREDVLRAHGIPRDRWPLYDVDHCPPYDPTREPDHRKYTLTPRLHGDHSRKTVREDGGWGKARRGGGAESLEPSRVDRSDEVNIFTREFLLKGSAR